MKALIPFACLLPIFAGFLHADVPRKPLPSEYRSLWNNSPFTTKPVISSGPAYNPLQDYVLLGVAPIKDGHRVTVLNRKRPNDDRLVIESNRPSDGFEILEVMKSPGSPMKTQVKLSKSGQTGTVSFEDKFLTLKTPPAAAKPPVQPSNRVQPAASTAQQPSTRVPRRRVIPPSSGGAQSNTSTNSNNQSGRTVPTPPVPSGR